MRSLYRYRGPSGQWSWLLHRITGIGVFVFLLAHIVSTYTVIFGEEMYNEFVGHYHSIPFRIGEILLFGALIFHSFNGIRVILVDFWTAGTRYQSQMFVVVLVISALAWIPASIYIMLPVLQPVAAAFMR